jgi:putative ABC transport system permease protein
MGLLGLLARRLKSLVRAGREEAETRDELRQHYDREIEALIASGLSPESARRAATLDIGRMDQIAEASRDARGLAWWDAFRSDVRYALCQIRRRPGFSAAAMLTIAIGVGATSAIFAVVDSVLLQPLPYPASERLYSLYEINTRASLGRTRATALNFLDWRARSKSFDGMAAHIGTGFALTGGGDPEFTLGQVVTPNLLDVLQVKPALGRTFLAHETEAGHHRVVILSHGLWTRRFGGDPSVVGSSTALNGQPYQVIGVLPASFAYPSDDYELLTPLVTKGRNPGAPPINRDARYLRVIARLGGQASETAARAELEMIGQRLAAEYPEANANVAIGMMSLADDTVGDAEARLIVVLVAVGFVLLIACVNVAGLSIARGHARSRELAVRAAIGASRSRLVRQLATESIVLFAIGGMAGVILAAWGVSTLASALPASIPRVHEIAIDSRFLIFGVVITATAGLLVSVLPALQIARRGPARDLAGSRGTVSAGRSTQRTRSLLIVAQVAAAVVLLAGAALALRSFQRVNAVDRGYDTANTMTFGFVLRAPRFPSADDMRAFLARTNEALQASPGAQVVGTTTHLPLSDNNLENRFTVDGSPAAAGQDPPVAGLRGVTGRYRAAIGARLLEGRDFLPSDRAGAEPVAIVTAGFAQRYITRAQAVGARLKMGGPDADSPWHTIVGVIADVRHRGLDREPRPEVWMPFAQMEDGMLETWLRGVYVVTRTAIDIEPESTIAGLRAAMRGVDAEIPLVGMQSFENLVRTSTAERRLETSMLAAFAAIALVLAAVGLFGVLAFYVAQHMQEFGVRLALGATPAGLLALVVRRGVTMLLIGLALGIPGALLLARGMSTLLFGVEPADPAALGAAVAVLSLVTLIASVLPARRAMNTDPLAALRND